MTAPLFELVVVYARRRNQPLAPDWAANAPADLAAGDPDAIGLLCAAAGWDLAPRQGKPRAHQFLAVLQHLGACAPGEPLRVARHRVDQIVHALGGMADQGVAVDLWHGVPEANRRQ